MYLANGEIMKAPTRYEQERSIGAREKEIKDEKNIMILMKLLWIGIPVLVPGRGMPEMGGMAPIMGYRINTQIWYLWSSPLIHKNPIMSAEP